MTPVRLFLATGPLLAAGALFVLAAAGQVPDQWPRALFAPSGDLPELLLHLAAFPRLTAALLAGAALAVAGAILQRVFANPLAEPGTIGALAGAQTALTALLIWAPGWVAAARLPLAVAGAGAAFLLVLALAARQGFSTLSLILSGMVVTLVLGGLNAMLALFHHDVLQSLFLWQAGSLVQDGWGGVRLLAIVLALAGWLALMAARPLQVIETGDESARSLGLPPGPWRVMLTGLAVTLSAVSAAVAGAVAFIGILAPVLWRLAGDRRPPLAGIALTGAGLLALADQLILRLPPGTGVQTGTAVALIGSVLLLALLGRVKPGREEIAAEPFPPATRLPRPAMLLAMLAAPGLALALGRTPEGWQVSLVPMLEWRLPRVLAAIAAGGAFGLAGAVLQRLLGNRLAGPELLGISGAASLGLVLSVLGLGATSRLGLYAATAAGALAGLALITLVSARRRFGPRDLLLAGLAVSMLLSALLAGVLASGHPMAGQLLGWLSGSTWRVALQDAALALAATLLLIPAALSMRRWLDALPLGAEAARSLGIDLRRARAGLVLVAALATAVGTLLVGPLGFVGLLAPNLARLVAPPRAAAQVPAAMACGAGLLLLADWLGRVLIYPWQIPAGLMALLLGGVLLMALLWRKPR